MANFNQKTSDSANTVSGPDFWSANPSEGKLAVDVLDAGAEIIVLAPMAGASQNSIEVSVHNDIITIRGERQIPYSSPEAAEFVHTECYWGAFSRTVILPTEVKSEQARAEYKNGVLVVRIPKRTLKTKIPVKIIEE